jgi:hypothetical protein
VECGDAYCGKSLLLRSTHEVANVHFDAARGTMTVFILQRADHGISTVRVLAFDGSRIVVKLAQRGAHR